MIIGNGLVARAFETYRDDEKVVIFASGVSDSKNSTAEGFERETRLLTHAIHNNKDKTLIYFGTTSVNDPDLANSAYVQHKLAMEGLILLSGISFHIFRLPNLAGSSNNPNTVLNFLYACVENDKPFDLWVQSERNIIDIDDVYKTAHYIIQQAVFTNKIVNIANAKNYPVKYIVSCIETFCGKKALYREVAKGSVFNINLTGTIDIYASLGITFNQHYLPGILQKYYSRK